jgi:hypothetical protein
VITKAAAAAASHHIRRGFMAFDGDAGAATIGPADVSSVSAVALIRPGATACANEAKKSAESFRADPSISRLPS